MPAAMAIAHSIRRAIGHCLFVVICIVDGIALVPIVISLQLDKVREKLFR